MEDISSDIVTEARNYIGVKFRHQGRSLSHGVDCLGLIICIAQQLQLESKQGIMLHELDQRIYSKTPDSHRLYQTLHMHLQEVSIDTISAGHIALMEFDRNPQHLAIISSYGNNDLGCIHAYAPARKVVEHRLDKVWRRKITHIFSI